ncbi:hypothetical protein E2C01_082720 [Portunus trituberculatus]|uniref:Uncharacterized protein n=1 Tax=Portunus trituberculatus TaxID=210409 RepID=A0A5B7IQP0_PORTR|nr:hypothetical protein [Portunus trituberculatus]
MRRTSQWRQSAGLVPFASLPVFISCAQAAEATLQDVQ